MPTWEIRVRGKVQGVGFRAYVVKLAGDLGVTGEVWNSRTGDVEMHAHHSNESVLAAFEAGLHDGPGRVGVVTHRSAVGAPELTDFRIAASR